MLVSACEAMTTALCFFSLGTVVAGTSCYLRRGLTGEYDSLSAREMRCLSIAPWGYIYRPGRLSFSSTQVSGLYATLCRSNCCPYPEAIAII